MKVQRLGAAPLKPLERVPHLTRADKGQIMGGNAVKLLKIKR